MPTPTAGLVEITLRQAYGSVGISNVFYYWDTTNTPLVSLAGLGTQFNAVITDNIVQIQSSSVAYTEVVLKDVLGTLPDLTIAPSKSVGVRTGEVLNSFTAAGYRLNPETKETRPGQKRFVGITEDAVSGNVFTGTYETILNTFGEFLDNSLVLTSTYVPVVASRPRPSRDFWVVSKVIGVTLNTFVTSQVSRKRR